MSKRGRQPSQPVWIMKCLITSIIRVRQAALWIVSQHNGCKACPNPFTSNIMASVKPRRSTTLVTASSTTLLPFPPSVYTPQERRSSVTFPELMRMVTVDVGGGRGGDSKGDGHGGGLWDDAGGGVPLTRNGGDNERGLVVSGGGWGEGDFVRSG